MAPMSSGVIWRCPVAGQRIALPKGHGLPPGAAATGHVKAMAMYAGELTADITAIEPVAHVIQSWVQAAALGSDERRGARRLFTTWCCACRRPVRLGSRR